MKSRVQILVGAFCLLVGCMVYVTGSQGASTYLSREIFTVKISLIDLPYFLGPLRGPLPEFLHPFAFSLIGMGLFARTRRSRFWICSSFLLMNLIFEFGQKFKGISVALVPDLLKRVPVLENTENFFAFGTFSIADLVAIFFGSVMAFIFTEVLLPKKGNNNEISEVVV